MRAVEHSERHPEVPRFHQRDEGSPPAQTPAPEPHRNASMMQSEIDKAGAPARPVGTYAQMPEVLQ